MTLTQLRYVIKIADTGSMNEASKALFTRSQVLSQAVKELETEDWSRVIQSGATEGCRLPRKEWNSWDTQDKL